MKKLISLMLILCMACMLIPAMADGSAAGVWYGDYHGAVMVLTLNEDGTSSMTVSGNQMAAGTWTENDGKIEITMAGAVGEPSTQAEALEKAKDILIRHFGGYTIQEAHGGWIDNETEYQEYTLVIYLSDTTPDKVHAAADEMIETFRQSSVLIQENPTRTEFYAGK